jgi:branched-chain amino acid transport system substrate-binding protein
MQIVDTVREVAERAAKHILGRGRSRRTHRRVRLLLLPVGLVLVMAGWSSGSKAGATASTTKSAWTIGFVCSCTGPLANALGPTLKVATAWMDWTNAHGGINGHPVHTVMMDDMANPGVSVADVKAMVEQDHIIAMVGAISAQAPAWASYLQQQGIPMIYVPFADNPDNFPRLGTPAQGAWSLLSADKEAGKKKLALLYCSEVAQCAQSVPAYQQQAPRMGMKLVYAAGISLSAPNYTAECLAAKEAGADSMVVTATSATTLKVAGDCAAQGYFPVQVTAAATSSAWLTSPPMEGAVIAAVPAPYFDDSTSAEKTFHAALRQYAPSVLDPSEFSDTISSPWTGGMLFEAAAKAGHLGDNPTPAQVIAGLYKLHNETLGGLIAPLTIPKGNTAPPRPCFLLARIHDHKFVFPNGHKLTCQTQT